MPGTKMKKGLELGLKVQQVGRHRARLQQRSRADAANMPLAPAQVPELPSPKAGRCHSLRPGALSSGTAMVGAALPLDAQGQLWWLQVFPPPNLCLHLHITCSSWLFLLRTFVPGLRAFG